MAKDPGLRFRILATVTGVEARCNAGHQEGDEVEIRCHNLGGLCGFFYHDIFPSLIAFQFGGNLPCEVLERVIDSTRWAPSAINVQPVRWLVIDKPVDVRALAGLIAEWMRKEALAPRYIAA